MEELNTEEKFMWKWVAYLLLVIYLSIGCYKYYSEGLKILYWPLHEHDISREILDVKETDN
tara:strand:- start:359 stop:541 length:183 start_codon:yes stop_codon:yes gene_type:complete